MASDDEVLLRIAADVSDATTGIGMLVGMFGEYVAQMNLASQATDKLNEETEKASKGFNVLAMGMSAMSKAADDAASDKMIAGMSAAGRAAEEANTKTKGFWETWIKGADQSGAAAITWGTLMADAFKKVGEGVQAAITSIPSMVSHMAAAGDEMGTMANRLDLSVEAVGRLQNIADKSGASMEGLARTVQTFSSELNDSSSKAVEGIESLGFSVEELKKVSAEQGKDAAMFQVIERIKEVTPVSEQGAKAMEIFGSKFRSQTMILKEDIGDLNKKFKEFGGEEGLGQLAKAGDAYEDALVDIEVAQDSFKRSIANALLPTVNKLLEAMPQLGGAVLTVGEGLMDTAKSVLPLVTNLAILNGPGGFKGLMESAKGLLPSMTSIKGVFAGIVPTITGLVTSMGGLSGIFAAITGPIGLTVIAVTALGAVLYKMVGGWEGIKSALEPLLPILQSVMTFFEDLGTIGLYLAEEVFAKLVEWATQAVEWFGSLGETVADIGTGAFAGLVEWVQKAIDAFSQFPGVGLIVEAVKIQFEALMFVVGKVWDIIQKVASKIGTVVKGAAAATHEWANSIRLADEATKDSTKTNEEHAKSTVKVASGLDRMLGKAKEVEAAYRALNTTQKTQIKQLLDAGMSTKDIAEQMASSMKVSVDVAQKAIDKFKKSLEDAKKAAKENPFNKLMEDAKELGKALEGAAKSGTPMSQILDTLGKKAADVAQRAALMPGAFAKLPPEVVKIADAFNAAELGKKIKDISEKALELAKAFSEKVTAGAAAAAAAIKGMATEMSMNLLTGSEKRIAQIENEEAAAIKAIKSQSAEIDKAQRENEIAIHKQFAERRKAEEAFAKAGVGLSKERLAQIAAEEEAAVNASKYETEIVKQGLGDQTRATTEYYAQKRALDEQNTGNFEKDAELMGLTTRRVYDEQIKLEERKLALMKKNTNEFSALQIKAQERSIAASKKALEQFEKDAKSLGLVTKAINDQQIAAEQEKLDFMKKAHAEQGEFSNVAIREQEKILQAAKDAASGTKISWDGALDSLAQAFTQLATIAGTSFGGILKTVGQTIGQVNVLSKGIKSGMDGMGTGIAQFKDAFGKAGGGVMGVMKGVMGSIGQIGGAIGGIISAASAAIEIGKKLWDGFTKSAGEKAAKEVGRDFGVKISEEMGDAFAKTAKDMFKGDRFAANIYHLSDIIKEAGGITEKNFTQMAGRLRDVFSMVDQGKFTVAQATKVLDENFSAFAKHVVQTGKIASKEFTEIIRLNAAMGTQSKEIMDFVASQADRLGSALAKMGATLDSKATESISDTIKRFSTDQVALLKKDYEAAQKGADAFKGSFEEFVAQQAEFYNTLEEGDARLKTTFLGGDLKIWNENQKGIKATEEAVARFERLTLAAFNSAVKAGQPYLDALDSIGPALDKISEKNKEMGRTGSAALTELLKFREVASANKSLVESAGALNEVMLALSNIGGLNVETMSDLQAQGVDTFEQLKAAGFTEAQALQQMKTFLEQVRDAHEALALPIDANTQAMIDQAEATGVLGQKQLSTNDVMMQGFSAIIKALGGEIPAAFQKMSGAAVDAAKTVSGATASVRTSVGEVNNALQNTQWDEWGQMAADAAAQAYEGVYAVSYGHSPGGLKDIPMWLETIINKSGVFAKSFVGDMNQALGATTGVDDAMQGVVETQGQMGAATGTIELAKKADSAKTIVTMLADSFGIVMKKSQDAGQQAAGAMSPIVNAINGVIAKVNGVPWTQMGSGAEIAATKVTQAFTVAGDAIDDMPWDSMSADAAAAAGQAVGAADSIIASIRTMGSALGGTPWAAWSGAAVDASQDVLAEVNAVSYGHSPGGLKDIGMWLERIISALSGFAEAFTSEMGASKDSVDEVSDGAQAMAKVIGEKIPAAFTKLAKKSEDSVDDMSEVVSDAVEGPLTDVTEQLEATGWESWVERALAGVKKITDAIIQLIERLIDTDTELTDMHWEGWSEKALTATVTVTGHVQELDDVLREMAQMLAENDWTSWAGQIVDAAGQAQAAVEAVSFGNSPGGIKEIPLQFAESIRAANEFSNRVGASMDEAKRRAEEFAVAATFPNQDTFFNALQSAQPSEPAVVDRDQETETETPINIMLDGHVLATAMLRKINDGGSVHGTFKTMVRQVN